MDFPDIRLNIYHARVILGAIWLDKKFPGWEGEISLESLDMRSTQGCILGQIWGTYRGAIDLHFVEGDRGRGGRRQANAIAARWGFILFGSNADWEMLKGAWVYEVLQRRGYG